MSALPGRLVAARKADHAAARDIPPGCWPRCCRHSAAKATCKGAGPDAAAAMPGPVEQLTGREPLALHPGASARPDP